MRTICLLLALSGFFLSKNAFALVPAAEILGVTLASQLTLKNTGEKLVLNGYAVRSVDGQKRYVAALYLPAIEKRPQMILLNNDPVSMQLFFVQDDVNMQSVTRGIVESIVMNNKDWQKRSAAIQELVKSLNSAKDSLDAGDILIYEYSPTDGMRVLLNGNVCAYWPQGKIFFNMLLNMWIGEYPPSAAFKAGILSMS